MPGISPSSSTESVWLYQERPQYERTCDGCQQPLRWLRSTNEKGQYLGYWYTSCPTAAAGCTRFKWASGSAQDAARASTSLSRSSYPADASGNGVQLTAMTATRPSDQPTTPGAPVVDEVPGLCHVIGCKSRRLHAMCTRRCCRKHCRALGGCGAKGHESDPVLGVTLQLRHQPNPDTSSAEPRFFSADDTVHHATHHSIPYHNSPDSDFDPSLRSSQPPPLAYSTPTSFLVDQTTVVSSPTVLAPSIQPSFAGSSRVVDKGKGKDPTENPHSSQLKRKASAVPLADQPCHRIHLNPIFTRAYAEAEEADARHRQRTGAQREAIERAKNQVTLCVWNENGPPDVYEIQQGFTHPHFLLTPDVLAKVGLVTIPDSNGHLVGPSSFKHYHPDHGIWTSFDVGHTVNVASDNDTTLLKRGSVVDHVDLGTRLGQMRTGPHSNLFTDLAAKRKPFKASLHSRSQLQPPREHRRHHTIARAQSTVKPHISDAISPIPHDPDLKDAPALDPSFVAGPSKCTGPHSNLFTNLAAEQNAIKACLHDRSQLQPLQERRRNHSIARARGAAESHIGDATFPIPHNPDLEDTPTRDPIFVAGGPSKRQVCGHSSWPFGSDEDSPLVMQQSHCASSINPLSSTEDVGIQDNSPRRVPEQPHQPLRAPSVISLSSTDNIGEQDHPYISGPSHQSRQHHRALSVISLSSTKGEDASSQQSTPDSKHTRKQHRAACNPPCRSSSPIVERRSQHGSTKSDAINLDTIRVWPYDFHACDIEAGFRKCREAVRSRRKVSAVFQKHFGTRFIKSTFYDHRRYWMEVVDASVRGRYIGYGHTDQGLWSVFLDKEIRNGGNV